MTLSDLLRIIRSDFRIILSDDGVTILYNSRRTSRPVPEWMSESLVLDYSDDGRTVTIEI